MAWGAGLRNSKFADLLHDLFGMEIHFLCHRVLSPDADWKHTGQAGIIKDHTEHCIACRCNLKQQQLHPGECVGHCTGHYKCVS